MDPSCGVKSLVRHFPCGLSLDPIQAQNAPHFNNAPAPRVLGGMKFRRFLRPDSESLVSTTVFEARNGWFAAFRTSTLADHPP